VNRSVLLKATTAALGVRAGYVDSMDPAAIASGMLDAMETFHHALPRVRHPTRTAHDDVAGRARRHAARVARLTRQGRIRQARAALTSEEVTADECAEAARSQFAEGGTGRALPQPEPDAAYAAARAAVPAAGPIGPDDINELTECIRVAAAAAPTGAGGGRWGVLPDPLHAAVREFPLFAQTLAEMLATFQRIGVPTTLAASACFGKRQGPKVRVITPPESVTRLFERAINARNHGCAGSPHLRTALALRSCGPQAMGVAMQGLASEGWTVVQLDLRRCFDVATKRRLVKAAMELDMSPGEIKFIDTMLERRLVFLPDGTAATLAPGRGGPQGSPLMPVLASAGTEKIARAADAAAEPYVAAADRFEGLGAALAHTCIDNVPFALPPYVSKAEVAAVVRAACDAAEAGDDIVGAVECNRMALVVTTARNTAVAVKHKPDLSILGVTLGAPDPKRIDRAHEALAKLRGMDADVTYRICSHSLLAGLVYDSQLGQGGAALSAIDTAVADAVAAATGVVSRDVLQAPLRDRGLGLGLAGPAAAARILVLGARLLTESAGTLGPVFWRHARMARDGHTHAAPFWRGFVAALDAQAAPHGGDPPLLAIEWADRVVRLAGAVVTFAPPGALAREALGVGRMAAQDGLRRAAELRHIDADVRSRVERSLTSRIFLCTATGGLRGDDYKAAVRMHTHTPEPELYGRIGDECPLCGHGLFAGHHRVCGGGHQAALTATHTAVRDVLCSFIRGTAGTFAQTEVSVTPILNGDGTLHHVRADVRVQGWDPGGVIIEVKTYDPRCKTWRKVTPDQAERMLSARGERQYAPGSKVRVLVLGADGTVGARTRALLMELIALREERGALVPRDHVPDLCCGLVEALARCESSSYRRWSAQVAVRVGIDRAAAASRAAVAVAAALRTAARAADGPHGAHQEGAARAAAPNPAVVAGATAAPRGAASGSEAMD